MKQVAHAEGGANGLGARSNDGGAEAADAQPEMCVQERDDDEEEEDDEDFDAEAEEACFRNGSVVQSVLCRRFLYRSAGS